jgi:Flp pilus assembly protein TadG
VVDVSQRGQATVELALLLPFVVLFAWVLVEIGMIATDNVRLWHAAREAARVGAVDPDPSAIRAAAASSGLHPIDLSVRPGAEGRIFGEPLTVSVTYRPTSSAPVIGKLFETVVMTAEATMRIEQP